MFVLVFSLPVIFDVDVAGSDEAGPSTLYDTLLEVWTALSSATTCSPVILVSGISVYAESSMAIRVSGPALPSAGISFSSWNFKTAFCVSVPKYPVAGNSMYPLSYSTCCISNTHLSWSPTVRTSYRSAAIDEIGNNVSANRAADIMPTTFLYIDASKLYIVI